MTRSAGASVNQAHTRSITHTAPTLSSTPYHLHACTSRGLGRVSASDVPQFGGCLDVTILTRPTHSQPIQHTTGQLERTLVWGYTQSGSGKSESLGGALKRGALRASMARCPARKRFRRARGNWVLNGTGQEVLSVFLGCVHCKPGLSNSTWRPESGGSHLRRGGRSSTCPWGRVDPKPKVTHNPRIQALFRLHARVLTDPSNGVA